MALATSRRVGVPISVQPAAKRHRAGHGYGILRPSAGGVGQSGRCVFSHVGVSENSVPLNPMVLLITIPIKWLFVWEYTLFSDKAM